MTEWKAKKDANTQDQESEEEDIYYVGPEADSDDEETSKTVGGDSLQPRFIAHVPVPSQQEVEQALLRRKKQELLEIYASESLIQETEKSKDLLGPNQ